MSSGKSPRIAIESVPPLASIDETDDDDLSGTSPRTNVNFIPSSCNKNLVILTNSAAAVPPITEAHQCPSRSSVFSPESDDFGCLTVTAAEEELADTGFFSSSISCSSKRSSIDSTSLPVGTLYPGITLVPQCLHQQRADKDEDEDEDQLMDDFFDTRCQHSMPKSMSRFTVASTPGDEPSTPAVLGSQSPDLSNSLEDLVNCFDDKVKCCLVNYQENVSTLAPVQMRSPEEYIRERPAWCTLTGNYGKNLPSVWSEMSPEGCHRTEVVSSSGDGDDCTSDLLLEDAAEEEARLKHLIDVCLELDRSEPIRTAEDILEEISNLFPPGSDLTSLSPEHSLTDMPIRRMSFYRFSLEKLKNLSLDQLQDLNEDLETKVQRHSEVLVKQLARRDELEFEKEQKNAFISLMLSLQNRRKVYFQEVQAKGLEQSTSTGIRRKLRYLTTVIPYNSGQAADNVPVLQVLIKILKAMLEDSPTVPTLLTDYILTHICPSESYSSSNSNCGITASSSSEQQQSTYLRSALRSLARSGQHSLGTVSAANATAFAQLTSTLNSKLKAAARRSFSFTAAKGGSAAASSSSAHSGTHCGTVLCQNNNNPDAGNSRKGSLSGAVQTYDTCNAIVA